MTSMVFDVNYGNLNLQYVLIVQYSNIVGIVEYIIK